MFVFITYQDNTTTSLSRIALIAAICAVAGLAFWAMMSAFIKLTTKYSGTERAIPRARSRRERAISLLSIPFAAGPIFYTLTFYQQYLWPVLASSLPAFLFMAPLVSRLAQPTEVAARALVSAVGGVALGIGLHQYFSTGTPFSEPEYLTQALLALSSISWCISYLLSKYANRRAICSEGTNG